MSETKSTQLVVFLSDFFKNWKMFKSSVGGARGPSARGVKECMVHVQCGLMSLCLRLPRCLPLFLPLSLSRSNLVWVACCFSLHCFLCLCGCVCALAWVCVSGERASKRKNRTYVSTPMKNGSSMCDAVLNVCFMCEKKKSGRSASREFARVVIHDIHIMWMCICLYVVYVARVASWNWSVQQQS